MTAQSRIFAGLSKPTAWKTFAQNLLGGLRPSFIQAPEIWLKCYLETSIFAMHANALNKETAAVFSRFKRFTPFYLVGGSALALQIGHRLSVDLDFFSAEELTSGLLPKIKRIFPDVSVEVTLRVTGQYNLLINRVKTTFFHYRS